MRDQPEKSFIDFLIICQVGDVGWDRRSSAIARKRQPRRLPRTLAVLRRRLRRVVFNPAGGCKTDVAWGNTR